MAITPRLTLAVLCQHVELDSAGRVYSLIEPLHAVNKPADQSWPFKPAEMMLYVRLEDAVGTFNFSAQVRNEANVIIGQTAQPSRVTFPGSADRHLVVEVVFPLPNLEFPGPGVYEVYVVCNHQPLPLLGAVEAAAKLRLLD